MPEKKTKLNFGELIEKYRFFIGGALLVLILIGSGVLLWRENYTKKNSESKVVELESKINDLENKYKEYQVSGIKYQAEGQASEQSAAPQGQIAGASSQNTAGQNADNSKQATAKQPVSGMVNINTATLAQLDTLVGIGPVYAQRIIDYRSSHGGFKSIDEIKNVKGIGDKTFDKFKDKITMN